MCCISQTDVFGAVPSVSHCTRQGNCQWPFLAILFWTLGDFYVGIHSSPSIWEVYFTDSCVILKYYCLLMHFYHTLYFTRLINIFLCPLWLAINDHKKSRSDIISIIEWMFLQLLPLFFQHGKGNTSPQRLFNVHLGKRSRANSYTFVRIIIIIIIIISS